MRLITQTAGAAGLQNWIPLDPRVIAFNVEIATYFDATGSMTFQVNRTTSDLFHEIRCVGTSSTTTLTITFPSAHGLTTADQVIISGSNFGGATGSGYTLANNIDGTYAVGAVSSATVITVTTTSTSGTNYDLHVVPVKLTTAALATGTTGTTLTNVTGPCTGVQLDVTAYSAGNVTMTVQQAGIR